GSLLLGFSTLGFMAAAFYGVKNKDWMVNIKGQYKQLLFSYLPVAILTICAGFLIVNPVNVTALAFAVMASIPLVMRFDLQSVLLGIMFVVSACFLIADTGNIPALLFMLISGVPLLMRLGFQKWNINIFNF